ncbi:hypothetical protein KAJ89_04050 [Candidatus Parcubacteria bacterium]|nr:hypothetical protein [Candidatus Parcubacteria bacterium]
MGINKIAKICKEKGYKFLVVRKQMDGYFVGVEDKNYHYKTKKIKD